jgi:hypothetical protein
MTTRRAGVLQIIVVHSVARYLGHARVRDHNANNHTGPGDLGGESVVIVRHLEGGKVEELDFVGILRVFAGDERVFVVFNRAREGFRVGIRRRGG